MGRTAMYSTTLGGLPAKRSSFVLRMFSMAFENVLVFVLAVKL
jgi:hypothetical protein